MTYNVLMGTLNPTALTHSFGRFRSNGMGLYRRVTQIFRGVRTPLLGCCVADPYKDVLRDPHVCYRADFGRSSSNGMGVRSGPKNFVDAGSCPLEMEGVADSLETHPFITGFITPILVALVSAHRTGTFHTGGDGTGLSCYRLQF